MSFDLELIDDDLTPDAELVTGALYVVQAVGELAAMHRGEWLLDRRVGLPFVAWLAAKIPDVAAVAAELERQIRAVPGVLRTEDVVAQFTAGRVISIRLTVRVAGAAPLDLSILSSEADARNGHPFAVFADLGS